MTSPTFNSGDDGVVAKLSVDINDTSISSLQDVVNLTRELRSNLEAVVRSQQTFGQQVDSMSSINAATADVMSGVQEVAAQPGPSRSRGAPDRSNPKEVPPDNDRGSPFSQSSTYRMMGQDSSVQSFISRRGEVEKTYQDDDEALIYRMNQLGLLKQEFDERGSAKYTFKGKDVDDFSGDSGLRGLALNSLTEANLAAEAKEAEAGRSVAKNIGMSARALGTTLATGRGSVLTASEGLLKSVAGRGGALTGAAKIAGGIGALASAGQVINQVGERYQDLRSAGLVRGEGVGYALGHEFQEFTRSKFDPFVNSQQVSQMMHAVEEGGYSGGKKDEAYDFMRDSLVYNNMGVAQSSKLLKTAVDEGGQSIAQLNSQLKGLKEAAKDAEKPLAQMQQQFMTVQASAVAQGIGGHNAGLMGMYAATMYSDNPGNVPYAIGDDMAGILAPATTDARFLMGMGIRNANGTLMTNPTEIAKVASNNPDELYAQYGDYLSGIAKQIESATSSDPSQGPAMFKKQMMDIGMPNRTDAEWSDLYNRLLNGNFTDEMVKQKEEFAKTTQVQKRNDNDLDWSDEGQGILETQMSGFSIGLGLGSEDETLGAYKIEAIESLLADGHSAQDIKVFDEKGKEIGNYAQASKNPDMLKKIANKTYKVSVGGSKAAGDQWLDFAEANGLEEFDGAAEVMIDGNASQKRKVAEFMKSNPGSAPVTIDELSAGDIYGSGAKGSAGLSQYDVKISMTPEASRFFKTDTSAKTNGNYGYPEQANDQKPGG